MLIYERICLILRDILLHFASFVDLLLIDSSFAVSFIFFFLLHVMMAQLFER